MVGPTLMHYKVVAEIGSGGMGGGYEALDRRLDRRVALKIYWKHAQQTKDPVSIKKAEDAFNEAIQLGLKDAADEREARDALRQIAVLKTPVQDAPTGDEPSRRPATDAPD